jgi:hypothetical protein
MGAKRHNELSAAPLGGVDFQLSQFVQGLPLIRTKKSLKAAKNSLFLCAGKRAITHCGNRIISRIQPRFSSIFGTFPCIFPVEQGKYAQTGSLRTASSAIVSGEDACFDRSRSFLGPTRFFRLRPGRLNSVAGRRGSRCCWKRRCQIRRNTCR